MAASSQHNASALAASLYEIRASGELASRLTRCEAYLPREQPLALSRHPAWLTVLEQGLQHTPYCLEVVEGEKTCGFLALAYLRSLLFGRFLVSLPYVNYGGVVAIDEPAARLLVDHAVYLANQLDVNYLELRHEQPLAHPALTESRTDKIHMRLSLPADADALWKNLSAKVRNQIRKGQKSNLTVAWGGPELLDAFYSVFSRNMRDLGTPVYGRRLFRAILQQFPDRAELCLVSAGRQPVATAILLHGCGVTEVPSASSLRSHNSTCANMLMYWHLLQRTVERRQGWFDFGRSTKDSPTYRFKKQWGAEPFPAVWQYYTRRGSVTALRPENPRYQRFIRIWRRLPVGVTRWIGPPIVRGIP